MKHLSYLLPVVALVLSACSRAPEPKPASDVVAHNLPVAERERSTPAVVGPCPFQWTCDEQRWYSTKAACTASCGPSCFLEEHSNGHCIPR